jgi:aminoglycoside phosphotransferase (APT) family kinase protein
VRITPVKVRRKKSAVYRLEGAGWPHDPVIAKRCRKAVASVERTVYEEILPRASVAALRYWGCFEEPDGERCWLFMEEATGAAYSDRVAEHRTLAARWLGRLHLALADTPVPQCLPDAGPGRYFASLRSVRELLEAHLDNPVLSSDDVRVMTSIRGRLDHVAAQWERIEEICRRGPQALVHGDFKTGNLRLRAADGEISVIVYDWENAGWGTPAVDLAHVTVRSDWLTANPDIPAYWSTVRERWPEMSLDAAWQLAHCGAVFRTLAALRWKASNLDTAWAHMYLDGVQAYVAALDRALEGLGWAPGARLPREVVGA